MLNERQSNYGVCELPVKITSASWQIHSNSKTHFQKLMHFPQGFNGSQQTLLMWAKLVNHYEQRTRSWLLHEYCLQWIIQPTIFITTCDENALLTPISIKLPSLPIPSDGQRILMKSSTAAFNVYLINKCSYLLIAGFPSWIKVRTLSV